MVRCGVAGLLLVALTIGCGSMAPRGGRELAISGSDTMLILNRRLAEGFMRVNPGIRIVVEGGGTSVGVDGLIRGEIAVAAASRPLTPAEVQRLYDRHQTLGVRTLIAQDAISVWVHPENPVTGLMMTELRGIFAGTVTSWSEVGGTEAPVRVVVRPPASGTHRFFRNLVLGGRPYSHAAMVAPGTRDVVSRVAGDVDSIGYGGTAYGTERVRACSIDGAWPTSEAASSGSYPLVRHLVFVTTAPPDGLSKTFLDWCQGPDGQAVVAEAGYLPLWRRP